MEDASSEQVTEPWSLLSKAENWRKLGLHDEAAIVADEAIEAQMKNAFDRLGVPKPASRDKAIRVLKKEGVRLSAERLLRLKEIRDKAGRDGGDSLSASEVDEAISIAEDSISKISEQQESAKDEPNPPPFHRGRTSGRGAGTQFKYHAGEGETFAALPFDSLGSLEHPYSHRKGVGQLETEFVTKLLLARAILNYRKKRIPRLVGLAFVVSLMGACSFLAVIGGSGLMLMLTGRSFFSVFGLVFDFVFLLVAYLFLRMALYVGRETR